MNTTNTKTASGQTEKKPKETDEIKELLGAYENYLKRIDRTEGRLAFLEDRQGDPSSPNLSGMPSGSGDGTSKQERDYIKIEELKEKLENMYEEENRKREEIEGLIELVENPDQQTVLELHYLDFANWNAINGVLFGEREDFDEKERKYLKRTYKIHGSALLSLARIYNKRLAQ